ncbi:MAG: hypothetical protein D6780_05215, partial [Candidatus Dadabacteria bacterium]
YLEKANDAEEGILNTREILQNLLEAFGEKLSFNSDRELTLSVLGEEFSGLTIKRLKDEGGVEV